MTFGLATKPTWSELGNDLQCSVVNKSLGWKFWCGATCQNDLSENHMAYMDWHLYRAFQVKWLHKSLYNFSYVHPFTHRFEERKPFTHTFTAQGFCVFLKDRLTAGVWNRTVPHKEDDPRWPLSHGYPSSVQVIRCWQFAGTLNSGASAWCLVCLE